MLCSAGNNQHFPSAMASHHLNQFQQQEIITPHDHDVLSGRGNFVNYHAGNEHFRALVRKHKVAYVACPKPQKSKFSRMIVEEIRNRNPPGRFLKQDNSTKLWYDIGEKKALDKTRQALREGAPEIMKELSGDDSGDEGAPENHQQQHQQGLQTLDAGPLEPIARLPSMSGGVEARSQSINNLPIDPSLVRQASNHLVHPGQFVSPGQFVQTQQSVANPFDNFAAQDAVGMLSDVNAAPQIVFSQHHQNGMRSNQHQPNINNGNEMLQAQAQLQTQSQQSMGGFVGNNTPIRSLASLRQAMQQQQANQHQANHHHQQQQVSQLQQSNQLSLGPTGLGLQGQRLGVNIPGTGSYQDVDSIIQTKMANLSQMQQNFDGELEPRPIGPLASLQFEQQAQPPPQPPSQQQQHHHHHQQQQTFEGEARVSRVAARRVPVRMPRRQGPAIERDGSERSLKMDGVFGGGSSHSKDNEHPRSGMDNSAVSIMSLSIGDIVHKMSGDDFAKSASSNDPDDLAPLFDSSVRLTATVEKKRRPPQRTNSGDGTALGNSSGIGSEQMGKSLDMSMATLGDRMSDFGESAARMTESQAEMSFANVFEEEDDVYGGDEGDV